MVAAGSAGWFNLGSFSCPLQNTNLGFVSRLLNMHPLGQPDLQLFAVDQIYELAVYQKMLFYLYAA
jgi:hypothetical protein